MWLVWYLICLSVVTGDEMDTSSCIFNSMCSCSPDQVNPNPSIDSIACYSVPFYKFPCKYEPKIRLRNKHYNFKIIELKYFLHNNMFLLSASRLYWFSDHLKQLLGEL